MTSHNITSKNTLQNSAQNSSQLAPVPTHEGVSKDLENGSKADILSVNAVKFLTEYQNDNESANKRYEGRTLKISGMLTGVLIPTLEQSERMADKGLTAHAIVTMGGLEVHSTQEAVLMPGVLAYSEKGTIFGAVDDQKIYHQLISGNYVTLICKVGESSRSTVTTFLTGTIDYNVMLTDCILQDNANSQSDVSSFVYPGQISEDSQTPTQSNKNDDSKTEIQLMLESWAKAHEANDPSTIATYYADEVDHYFLRQHVSNTFIRDNMENWYKTHEGRESRFSLTDVNYDDQTDSSAKIRLVKHVVETDSRGSSESSTHSLLYLKKIDEKWKITSEQDFK